MRLVSGGEYAPRLAVSSVLGDICGPVAVQDIFYLFGMQT